MLEFFPCFLRSLADTYPIMKYINETPSFFNNGRPTGSGAHKLLQAYYPEIAGSILGGVSAWEALVANNTDLCLPLASRTRACFIHDHMEKYARDAFQGLKPDVVLSSEAGFLIVDFHGKIKMRFKKLSSDLHPCNVKTEQQRACDDQTLYAPPATLVTGGYRLDALGVFRDAHIVCWDGSELLWSLPLPDLPEMRQEIKLTPDSSPPQPVVAKKVSKTEKRASTGSVWRDA